MIGLLGGIASGKSRVARLLAGPRGLVVDADLLAHEALDASEVRTRVRERFGERVLAPDGRVDRAALAQAVFSDREARTALESWIHPLVRAKISALLERARASGVPQVVLDVPLLLENDAEHRLGAACDTLIFVDAPESERERRARAQRGWTAGELRRREAAQLPLDRKRARAHHVLENRGDLDELDRAARELAARLGLS